MTPSPPNIQMTNHKLPHRIRSWISINWSWTYQTTNQQGAISCLTGWEVGLPGLDCENLSDQNERWTSQDERQCLILPYSQKSKLYKFPNRKENGCDSARQICNFRTVKKHFTKIRLSSPVEIISSHRNVTSIKVRVGLSVWATVVELKQLWRVSRPRRS